MLNLKTCKPRGWLKIVGACTLVGALSACGGGGGDDPVAGAATPATGATPATLATPAPPTTPATATAPSTNPSSGIENSGNLNYLVFEADGSASNFAAAVAFAAPNGTLTLLPGPDELVISTTDGWATVAFPTNFSGVLRADGNVALICSVEPGQGNLVLVSHNMTAVPSNEAIALVSGKTFTYTECDTGTAVSTTFAFNPDGSITDGTDSVSATDIASAFSAEGWNLPDGGKLKLSLYAYTVGGVTRYHLVEASRDSVGGVLTDFVALSSEQNPS